VWRGPRELIHLGGGGTPKQDGVPAAEVQETSMWDVDCCMWTDESSALFGTKYES
jgi:hypothetical protein